jgi:hypothetical protein
VTVPELVLLSIEDADCVPLVSVPLDDSVLLLLSVVTSELVIVEP